MAKPRACRSTLKLKNPIDTDSASLARRATQKRLSKARLALEAFEVRLQALHADKTGSARAYYGISVPLIPYEASGKLTSIARSKREAAEGCSLCAAWLEETAELRERIETLRNTPLPDRDPSYTGWPLPMSAVNAMGKALPYYYLKDQPRQSVTELLAEREARQTERKARGATFLQEFQQELAKAPEANAAANIPH